MLYEREEFLSSGAVIVPSAFEGWRSPANPKHGVEILLRLSKISF